MLIVLVILHLQEELHFCMIELVSSFSGAFIRPKFFNVYWSGLGPNLSCIVT